MQFIVKYTTLFHLDPTEVQTLAKKKDLYAEMPIVFAYTPS